MWARAAALLAALGAASAQVLTPPIFNLAENKEISATATCGEDVSEPELYCRLTGGNADKEVKVQLIQGQVCDYCDPSDPERAHPPEYAIDGSERWWQSPPLSRGSAYNEVNVTLDLGQEFHVAYVFIRMANSPRPGVWVLERSRDHGKTYEPWSYFADTSSDCEAYFGSESLKPIVRDDDVRCETEYSKVVPLEDGEIPYSLLNGRPSKDNFYNSSVLREWTRATNIRLRLLRAKTLLGHLMSVAQQVPTVTRRYFYSIKDISVGGRCVCNGHADLCDPSAEDQYRLLCRCQHNTCGPQCEVCCPPFVQKKWKPATYTDSFECEPCNCHGHSNECEYSEEVEAQGLSLDMHGNYEGGGVCQNCQHHTTGINCDQCEDGYFRPFGVPLDDPNVCQQCDCGVYYSTGNCAEGTGQCECRPEFQPPNCDDCSFGFYGYPDCRPCDCNLNGTRANVCEVGGGQCPCKPNFEGQNCDRCAPGFFNFPACEPCECNAVGSVSEAGAPVDVCAVDGGQCDCLSNFGGRQCDQCQDGYFGYPDCDYCNCDSSGTEPGICDKELGVCQCREGFGGELCDQCASGFFGYPNCRLCDCYVDGSTSTSCSAVGKCSCLSSFSGQQCDQCSPGYYNFPECLPCNCDPSGSIGLSCNGDGTCQCKPNFDGDKCDMCRENFYNFPLCEGCNCDPAGVTSSFAGCGALEHLGELCECKAHVTGRICDTCRPLFWNLQLLNPDGCEDCDCNPSGTVGGVRVCDTESGQCPCKAHVTSRQCQECSLGSYRLTAENLLGCETCNCDIGGAINDFCDKYTGQCACRPRVTGPSCKEPLQLHYFPDLHQYKYEAEDGRTPANSAVRFGYDEREFPGYSWRGYAVFSPLQREIIHDIWVEKPSLYRLVMRYVNPMPSPIIGDVQMTPENPLDIPQNVKVRFEPSREPALVTVSGTAGDLPAPLVLNPGRWTITVQNEIEGLRLDYFALLPAAYYEATILQDRATEPCYLQAGQPLCLHYAYPDLSWAAGAGAAGGLSPDGGATQLYDNQEVLDEVETPALARLDDSQESVTVPLTVDGPGRYVLAVHYLTPPGEPAPRNAVVRVVTSTGTEQGTMAVNRCDMTMLCRQVVTDQQGRVFDFNFDSPDVGVVITTEGGAPLLVDSVVAVPVRDWHMDYVKPQVRCVREQGRCIATRYPAPPESSKVEFESGLDTPPTAAPDQLAEEDVGLVHLDRNSSMVDVRGQVPEAGPYVFVVHYYQPDHPELELPVLVQNGQFYEAKLRAPHCASSSGCRAVVEQADGNKVFNILENFMFTLKEPTGKGVYVDYLYAVPESVYNWEMLEPLQLDRSAEFLERCGQNHFMVDTDEQGFCREAVFSLTADYNNGALECQCDSQGSESFECRPFGGQCPCRPNVIGRQCSRCRTGHFGFPDCRPCDCPSTALCDDSTGECICPPRVTGERCDQCVPLTYGFDPLIGCEECDCHQLGVRDGDLQCDLETGQCPCKPNIVSRKCDICEAGSWAYPYCQLCDCDLRGTTEEICSQETAECFCKENVEGRQCDQCRPGTYNMAETNPDGCTRCFCFGKTESCTSSFLFWNEIPALREMEWNVAAVSQTSTGLDVQESKVALEVRQDRVRVSGGRQGDISYFVPGGAGANMLTSYGGQLRYTVVPSAADDEGRMSGADVILTGANITLLHYAYSEMELNVPNEVTVRLEERSFRLPSGPDATREQLMQVLQRLDGLYIKATYLTNQEDCVIFNVTLSAAVRYGDPNYDQVASSVEECACPSSYTGLSCEECAPGHYRAKTGPYGGYCVPCNCNGHATECDPLTGKCFDCDHSTTGDHCEKCIAGYHGDATGGTPYDCLICACPLPIASNNFAESCEVTPDGRNIRCECRTGYYGLRCEACAAGFFGSPEVQGGSCQPCQCSGNIDVSDPGSCDSVTGDCLRCLNNTDGPACNLCANGFFGDAVVIKDCQPCNCDDCGTARCERSTGFCTCKPNVEGEKCDRCAPNCWGFQSCQGCRECDCAEASESTSCDYETGQCRCRPGAAGRRCDQCAPGYWNYGPTGCQSCNCNEEYSHGVGCNPQTGQCECLRGVEGPRCERCPYRWILIPGQGCEECDSCVHDLLDTTDNLEAVVRPIMNEFESYAGSYFLNQKLMIMNDTYHQLRPQVDAISGGGVDISPLELQVSSLERQAKADQIQSQAITGRAKDTKNLASKVRGDAEAVEEQINEAVQEARNIVRDIIALAQGLKVGAGPQIDLALSEAESLLAQIQARDFGPAASRVENELEAAILLLDRVRSFSGLVSERWQEASGLRSRLDNLEARLADLREQSSTARDQALQTLELVSSNRIQIIEERVQDVGVIAETTAGQLDTTAEWLDKARQLLADARAALLTLQLQAERVLASQQAVDIRIGEMNKALDSVTVLVRQAENHATDLMMQAQMLDNMLADTRAASEGAIRAANSYKDIVTAISEALEAARAALEAAEEAGRMSDGIGDRALQSRQVSEELLAQANGLLARVIEELRPQLESAKFGVDEVDKMNQQTRAELTIITESLSALERYQLEEEAREAARVATDANAAALDALDRVADISAKLPTDLAAADALARDMEDARKAIQLASDQVERVEGIIPNMKTLMTSVDEKYTVINVLGKDVGDKLEELRRKVAVAREKTNSIGVGVQFSRDMTLRLKNPEGLDRAATSTEISFYFRTDQPNGFLMYLGNEVGTKDQLRRTTSDDFISAEVIQGNLNVLVDLGSGAQRIINDAVYVSDGVWRKAVISRKGRQVKVKVISEDSEGREKVEEVESILPGSKSVLNLDQAKSVLHVGGFPTSAKVQENVRYTTFEGAIEELKINDVPVGLWNFASQTNLKNRGAMVRDKLVKLVPATGLRFNGDGYAAFQTYKHTFKTRFSLQLRFKTFSEDGLLFLAGKGRNDFLSVEMVGGNIVFQYSLGDGPVTMRGTGPYNDGEWHVVEAAREQQDGVLKIDSQFVDQGSSPGNSKDLSVSEMMYFGGYPGNVPYEEVTNSDFEGCLDEVYVSGSNMNLGLSKEALGVTPGCPARVATDVSFDVNSPGYVAVAVDPAPFDQLTLKFKTVAPDGLLFYSTNRPQSQYLSLSMRSGGLVLRSSAGGEVSTASFSRYDDDQWHVVTASRTEDNILLEIDDYETFQLPNAVPGLAVDLHSPLYFGGVPDSLRAAPDSAATLANYAGCLGDATVNSVFVNFADASDRPNAQLEKCPLSRPVAGDQFGAGEEGVSEPTLIDLSETVKEEATPPYDGGEEEDVKEPEMTDQPPTEAPESETTPPPETEPPAEPTTAEPTTAEPTTEEPTTARPRLPPPEPKEQCALPLRPNEDDDITVYSGQRFGNKPHSRWEYNKLPGKIYIESSVTVEFKTRAREGIIFYAAAENQIDFLALYLKNGNVVYAFDCGSGEAVISSPEAYNDDSWHTARFDRRELLGELYIDDVLVASGKSTGNSRNIQVDPPYFLGGLSKEIRENERMQGNVQKIDTSSFNGCLRGLRLSNQLFGNPARSVDVTTCSSKVEQGAFFSVEGGYMIVEDRFRVGLSVVIELEIRPRKLGGILVAVHGKKDFLLLQMLEDGSLRLTVENGRGEMISNYTPPKKHTLCDGEWHNIRVVKVRNVATLSVDDITMQPVLGVAGVSSTDTNSPLYVGGVPNRNVRGVVTQEDYVGCIRNLAIQDRPSVGLGYAKVVGAVTANTCPLL